MSLESFRARLSQLTSNDGVIIRDLTVMARELSDIAADVLRVVFSHVRHGDERASV